MIKKSFPLYIFLKVIGHLDIFGELMKGIVILLELFYLFRDRVSLCSLKMLSGCIQTTAFFSGD